MKLKTNFFLTICESQFPQVRITIDPESFNEEGDVSAQLTYTLVEYFGMHNIIAGLGEEIENIVKMQGSHGLKLEETLSDATELKLHIFYVDSTQRHDVVLQAIMEATKNQLSIFELPNQAGEST